MKQASRKSRNHITNENDFSPGSQDKGLVRLFLHITFCLVTNEEKIMNTIMTVYMNHLYTYFK